LTHYQLTKLAGMSHPARLHHIESARERVQALFYALAIADSASDHT
jgi:hypothetical protein